MAFQLAARKSRVASELRKLGHQRCEYENEMARILRRESAAAALIQGTWEYEKKKKKLEAELANALSQQDKGDDGMAEGLKEEEEEEVKEEEEDEAMAAGQQAAPSSDPEEKPKKIAKLANPYLSQASRSSHPVNLRTRPTKKL